MRNSIILILLLFFSMNLFCQSDTSVDTTAMYDLDPITITATRIETTRSIVTPSISVISREILAGEPQKSILSLVAQQVPGVFVPERGILGFGINTGAGQISIRGVGGEPNTRALVLVDGRPQYMGLFGHPLSDSYLATSVDRIEIIRGPSSVLYGSNAMGGVINIISHTLTKPGISADASASYGSFNSQLLSAKVGYVGLGVSTLVSLSHQSTDGHRPYSNFNSSSGYIKSSSQIIENVSVSVDGSLTKFKTYDPGPVSSPFINNWANILRGYFGVTFDTKFSGTEGSVRFIHNFGDHEIYDGFKSSDFNSTLSLYQSVKVIPDNIITLGVDLKEFGGIAKNIYSTYPWEGSYSVYEAAGYISVRHSLFQRIVLNGGVRIEHNKLFGNAVVPEIGATVKIDEETSARASAAKGFRSPTISELYMFAPTPTLQPEKLWNYEIGVSHMFDHRISTEVVGFVEEGSNLIRTEGNYPNVRRTNSGTFVHRGIECSATAVLIRQIQVRANYSYLDAGKETRSTPKHKIFIGGNYTYQMATFSLSIQHVEVIYGNDNSQNRLGNFTHVGVRVSARLFPQLSINLSADNLLDEKYQTILGYPMPGSIFTIGMQAGL
jgi:iron complex outermembrane receptor protein